MSDRELTIGLILLLCIAITATFFTIKPLVENGVYSNLDFTRNIEVGGYDYLCVYGSGQVNLKAIAPEQFAIGSIVGIQEDTNNCPLGWKYEQCFIAKGVVSEGCISFYKPLTDLFISAMIPEDTSIILKNNRSENVLTVTILGTIFFLFYCFISFLVFMIINDIIENKRGIKTE